MKTKWFVEDVWKFSPNDKDYAERFLLENDLNIAKRRLAENKSLIARCDLVKDEVSYSLNDFGFRCDDFTDINQEERIFIFVGCSFTFGSAVRKQDTWAFKAHEIISSHYPNEKIRFINLGWPGSGLDYSARILLNFCSWFNVKKLNGVFCLCPSLRRFEIPMSINTTPNIFAHHFPNINIDDDNFELMQIAKAKRDLIQNDNFCLNEAVKSVNQIKLLCQALGCEPTFGFMDNQDDRAIVDHLIKSTSIQDNLFKECRYDLTNDYGIDYLHPGPRWHSQFVEYNLDRFK